MLTSHVPCDIGESPVAARANTVRHAPLDLRDLALRGSAASVSGFPAFPLACRKRACGGELLGEFPRLASGLLELLFGAQAAGVVIAVADWAIERAVIGAAVTLVERRHAKGHTTLAALDHCQFAGVGLRRAHRWLARNMVSIAELVCSEKDVGTAKLAEQELGRDSARRSLST